MADEIDSKRPRVSLLVTDLDNTLWDWFDAWVTSFPKMLSHLSTLSGVPVPVLEDEARDVHRLRGTSEYSNLLDELPSLRATVIGDDRPSSVYDAALHTLHSARRRATHLYPGVEWTLRRLHAAGVPVAAYTESVAYWTEWRIRFTQLDGLIDVLYSAPDHDLPVGITIEDLRKLPAEEYGLKRTRHEHSPAGVLKPDPLILRRIIDDYGVDPSTTVYVGDSLMKDVAMAKDVGALDVHAVYGVPYLRGDYDSLRRVSHWSQADIDREKRIAGRPVVVPSYRLKRGFAELLEQFDFGHGA